MCTSTANFLDSNIFAALVGGLIGFFSSWVTSIWYTARQARIAKLNGYRAWCNGVQAEINHLFKVMDQIDDTLKKPDVVPTKRLNHDYLEQARIKINDYDDDLGFFETLTNTYRDVVHTNDMLDRLEKGLAAKPNVIESMVGVRNSTKVLDQQLKAKIQHLLKK